MHPPGGTSGAGGLPVPDEPLGPGGQPPRGLLFAPVRLPEQRGKSALRACSPQIRVFAIALL